MAINIVLAASFQLLWGMLNVIQLIVSMPLINVSFPANTSMFYSLIMNMAQFNLLPSVQINKSLFNIDDQESTDNVPDNFQMMDIFAIESLVFLCVI